MLLPAYLLRFEIKLSNASKKKLLVAEAKLSGWVIFAHFGIESI